VNYKHLYYFLGCAKAGGIVRAGEQLHVTPQTLSTQIKLLEGPARLPPVQEERSATRADRGGAYRASLRGADLHARARNWSRRFRTCEATGERSTSVSDRRLRAEGDRLRLLEPALAVPAQVRLICHEGTFEDLLAQISVNRLDLVIADEPMGKQTSVKAFNHALGTTAMSFFAAPR
jgi:LysR family transcriptional activator of nhaA